MQKASANCDHFYISWSKNSPKSVYQKRERRACHPQRDQKIGVFGEYTNSPIL